ncbi:hypothetical protein JB92DRAFT_3072724 [Gautieria morchelliformis]|nr:hypothetical protein JB92DRAFT_3072724 [Gautieria morchelliformis]
MPSVRYPSPIKGTPHNGLHIHYTYLSSRPRTARKRKIDLIVQCGHLGEFHKLFHACRGEDTVIARHAW